MLSPENCPQTFAFGSQVSGAKPGPVRLSPISLLTIGNPSEP
jgi:hypothetical protein